MGGTPSTEHLYALARDASLGKQLSNLGTQCRRECSQGQGAKLVAIHRKVNKHLGTKDQVQIPSFNEINARLGAPGIYDDSREETVKIANLKNVHDTHKKNNNKMYITSWVPTYSLRRGRACELIGKQIPSHLYKLPLGILF